MMSLLLVAPLRLEHFGLLAIPMSYVQPLLVVMVKLAMLNGRLEPYANGRLPTTTRIAVGPLQILIELLAMPTMRVPLD